MSPAIELLLCLPPGCLLLPVTVVLFTLILSLFAKINFPSSTQQLYGGKIRLCLSPSKILLILRTVWEATRGAQPCFDMNKSVCVKTLKTSM